MHAAAVAEQRAHLCSLLEALQHVHKHDRQRTWAAATTGRQRQRLERRALRGRDAVEQAAAVEAGRGEGSQQRVHAVLHLRQPSGARGAHVRLPA
jgi:hypothetical protein